MKAAAIIAILTALASTSCFKTESCSQERSRSPVKASGKAAAAFIEESLFLGRGDTAERRIAVWEAPKAGNDVPVLQGPFQSFFVAVSFGQTPAVRDAL